MIKKIYILLFVVLLVIGCGGSEIKSSDNQIVDLENDLRIDCLPVKVGLGDEVKCDVKVNKEISSVAILQFIIDSGDFLSIEGLTDDLGIIFNKDNGKGVFTSVDSFNFLKDEILFTINLKAERVGSGKVTFSEFKMMAGVNDDLGLTIGLSNTIVVN
jgi:hypothetical protein